MDGLKRWCAVSVRSGERAQRGGKLRWLLLSSLLTLWVGCAGTEVGNPADTDLQVAVRGYDSSQRGALVLGSGDVVESAWLVISEMEFKAVSPQGGCEGDQGEEREVPAQKGGPFAVELVTGQALPATPTFKLLDGTFCRLELKVAPLEQGVAVQGAPQALMEGASLVLKGARADGQPFVVEARLDVQVKLEPAGQRFALEMGTQGLLLGVSLDVLLAGSGLDRAQASPDGVIRVDFSSDSQFLEDLSVALRGAMRLFRDLNRDGALGVDDRAAPIAEGEAGGP
jgi:hypothetical protein